VLARVLRRRDAAAAAEPAGRTLLGLAAGAAAGALWLAPVPLGYLAGRVSFTYGNPYFDPAFRRALPAVGALLLAGFALGLEPYVRDGRGRVEARRTVAVVALVVLSGLRGRPGQGGFLQWDLLLWEAFCLRIGCMAVARLARSALAGAGLLAVFATARFFALSRIDGPHETLAHYVASPLFLLGVQLLWPGLAAGALYLLARRLGPSAPVP